MRNYFTITLLISIRHVFLLKWEKKKNKQNQVLLAGGVNKNVSKGDNSRDITYLITELFPCDFLRNYDYQY